MLKHLCAVECCNNKCYAKTYCHKHYQRYLKYGNVNTINRKHNRIWKSFHGYLMCCTEDNKDGIHLHRIIMEQHLERKLSSNEVVHHKDFNKLNNKITNLEVITDFEHRKLHSLLRGRKWKSCKVCNKLNNLPKANFSNGMCKNCNSRDWRYKQKCGG